LELPLTALKEGDSGLIKSIRANPRRRRGSRAGFLKRRMDMGLTPGTKVTVIKSAPFHGPIEVFVRGSRLALGRDMAEMVLVEMGK